MPSDGVSTDWLEAREDEIAQFLTARDQADSLQRLLDVLHRRKMISDAYYEDARDALDDITCALLTGKKNTARLRNLALTRRR